VSILVTVVVVIVALRLPRHQQRVENMIRDICRKMFKGWVAINSPVAKTFRHSLRTFPKQLQVQPKLLVVLGSAFFQPVGHPMVWTNKWGRSVETTAIVILQDLNAHTGRNVLVLHCNVIVVLHPQHFVELDVDLI